MSFKMNNLALDIAHNVVRKFGSAFSAYPSQVRTALVRSEAWLLVACMEDSEVSAGALALVIDAELAAEDIVERELKRLSKKR